MNEEYLKYTHQNILTMTANCDTKASFLLAILGLVVSSLVSFEPLHMFIKRVLDDYSITISNVDWMITINMVCYLLSALGILIVFFLLLCTLVARLQSNNFSLLFFKTISAVSDDIYKKKVNEMTTNDLYSDFTHQIHTCSCICAKKYKYFNAAISVTKVTVLLLAITIVLTLVNYFRLF